MLYFLLAIIAIGILLASKPGRVLLLVLVSVGLLIIGLIAIVIFWDYLVKIFLFAIMVIIPVGIVQAIHEKYKTHRLYIRLKQFLSTRGELVGKWIIGISVSLLVLMYILGIWLQSL